MMLMREYDIDQRDHGNIQKQSKFQLGNTQRSTNEDRRKGMEADDGPPTQHPQHASQQGSRIIVLDDHLEQSQLHDIVNPDQTLGDHAQSIELSDLHILRQPLLVRAVGDVDIEAVQLGG